jgi:hypothetical protein
MNSILHSKINLIKFELQTLSCIQKNYEYLVDSLDCLENLDEALRDFVYKNFNEIIRSCHFQNTSDFTFRGLNELLYSDAYGNHYILDIHSHNICTDFSMPNLTANRGLVELYDTPENVKPSYFMIMIFSYRVVGSQIVIEDVVFSPIEHLDWSCLTIGALGWGQIQIKNSNNIVLNYTKKRKDWMIELCDKMLIFYPNEVEKIGNRIEYFTEVKKKWLNKVL